MRSRLLPLIFIACSVLLQTPAAAGTIVSVNGLSPSDALAMGSGDQFLAVHWSETTSFSNVNISADIACFRGCTPTSGVEAWLMTQIGPGTTTLQQVATTSVNFLPTFSFVNLFSGLTLGTGDYYLVLSSPSSVDASWAGASDANATVVTAPGVSREDMLISANAFNGTPDYVFPPDSAWDRSATSGGDDYNLEFQVSNAVPEPSTFFLTSGGVLAAIIIRKRISGRSPV
jgi:hypothetical protein